MIEQLLPLACLLTPNAPEAAVLIGEQMASSEDELTAQGQRLAEISSGAILMKGGHLAGDTCIDVLIDKGQLFRYENRRVTTGNTHGTGCTLSSAVTAGLAKGLSLPDSVESAEHYLHRAIEQADDLRIGRGHGPVHHFHHYYPARA